MYIINSRELHIISAEDAVYHQTEAGCFMHGKAVMIYKGVSAFDDIQAQALDDIPNLASLRFG